MLSKYLQCLTDVQSDLRTPSITTRVHDLSHENLRRLAGECGLHTSRSSKFLIKDLVLIQKGEKEKIPLCNWKLSNLIRQPSITMGVYLHCFKFTVA